MRGAGCVYVCVGGDACGRGCVCVCGGEMRGAGCVYVCVGGLSSTLSPSPPLSQNLCVSTKPKLSKPKLFWVFNGNFIN